MITVLFVCLAIIFLAAYVSILAYGFEHFEHFEHNVDDVQDFDFKPWKLTKLTRRPVFVRWVVIIGGITCLMLIGYIDNMLVRTIGYDFKDGVEDGLIVFLMFFIGGIYEFVHKYYNHNPNPNAVWSHVRECLKAGDVVKTLSQGKENVVKNVENNKIRVRSKETGKPRDLTKEDFCFVWKELCKKKVLTLKDLAPKLIGRRAIIVAILCRCLDNVEEVKAKKVAIKLKD